MEFTEKYGLDVDEAVRLALEEMGLTEDQVMVTVLEEPTKGFLGIGQKLAKVRVERIDDLGDLADLSQAEALRSEAEGKTQTKANYDFRKKKSAQQQDGEQDTGYQRPERQERPDRGGRREGGDRDRGRGRDQGGYRRGDRDQKDRDHSRGRDRDHDRTRAPHPNFEGVEINIDLSQVAGVADPIENLTPDPENEAAKFLREVLEKMNLEVEVEGFHNDECNYVEVKGTDSRMVIGKRGQTLDALQYLTNLVSNKEQENYKRAIIDVEGYRSRREKTLEELAVKLAKKVLKTGHAARLEPMNPYERKVIHATLQNVDHITTKSEGDEPYRRVIIERK